jgi:type I restriction enzyme S subunit
LAKKIPDKGYARHYQHLEKTIIPLPPLPEQHQIVARLEELFSDLEDGIVSLKKAQEQLKTYRQAVLKYAFEGKLTAEWRKQHQPESAETLLKQIKTERERQYQSKLDEWQQTCEQATAAGKKKPPKPKKPKDLPPLTEAELAELPELPKGWCWVKLGAIINDGPSNGYSPRSGKDAKGTKSLKLTATTSRKLILNDSTIKWLYEKIDENSKYWLKDGDILIQRANTLEYLGATAIYKGKPNEYIYPDLMMRIRIKNDIMTRYTWHFCNSLFGRIYFRSNATGIAGNMPKISGATLINLLIPIPNIKEQHQIVQEIESRLSVCDQLEQTIADSLQKAESLRQSILKQAFEGKLTEPWRKTHPNLISGEHSAAALLERIRTEKEKLTSKKQ